MSSVDQPAPYQRPSNGGGDCGAGCLGGVVTLSTSRGSRRTGVVLHPTTPRIRTPISMAAHVLITSPSARASLLYPSRSIQVPPSTFLEVVGHSSEWRERHPHERVTARSGVVDKPVEHQRVL